MARPSGATGGVTLGNLARIGAGPVSIVNATPATLMVWRAQLARLKGGAADAARIACVGDSKTAGAGAGTGSQRMDGAFPKAWPTQLAGMFVGDGFVVRDSWFGTAGMQSMAAIAAYDPRRSGFTGWGGGEVSLGGPTLATNGTNTGAFQPSRPVDRASVFVRISSGGGVLRISKGAESFTINTAGTEGFTRSEIVFATKSADPIQYGWASGGYVSVAGTVAWDSALPGIEVANTSIYGTTSVVQSATAKPASPLAALGTYQPHLTFVKLGTNDINTGVTLPQWEANLRAIVATARTTGSVVLVWPSIGGVSPAYGADDVRRRWQATALRIALTTQSMFLDEEALLGGRSGAQASGALPDGVHTAAWAQLLEAATQYRVIGW
ncbi:SGNH/GDSL hydrolase family protein [uncultured Sphingomonas sp.]|uniref:SGNH/GDSL hydrolase family protein n=1 Tax=uncultured Sphingomonas sp. TaxID=158754 RepID=UPI0025E1FAE0|nr:SGNH/GDSL hydrolase family protein [uncultured Sphingomonas sp.]